MGQENNKKKENNATKIEEEKTAKKDKTQSEQQQLQGNNNANKKRKRKEVFPFGNYRGYYGYRISPDSDEDPRLKVMKKEWFEGKDCLDIGCNSGIITIQIAKKFQCRSILGIDIDSCRIEDANWHLSKFMKLQYAGKAGEKKSRSEVANEENGSEKPLSSLSNGEAKETTGHKDLSRIVSFRKENIVQSRNSDENRYDTILCLSVTKWIHLNWGDDGLMTVFSKIWNMLHPGGIFVLEPQPWKSYESNRRVSETIATNYRKIVLRPDHFRDILLDKVGFRTAEDLTSSLSGTNAGFDRPIFAFQK